MKTLSFIVGICMIGCYAIKAQTNIDSVPGLLIRELIKINGERAPNILPIDHFSNGKFYKVEINSEEHKIKYIYIGRVNTCRAGGCSGSSEPATQSESEYFDYYILYNANCLVRSVKVYNYQATHGQEIAATGWLKQFIGYDGSYSLTGNKHIDAISGATISVFAISADVEAKTKRLFRLIGKQTGGAMTD
ncbi:MAG TPA: FMN-binding protein [Bacteroidales bacterium]|nr:FMN-binding protein [Bacteroidales bacterium]